MHSNFSYLSLCFFLVFFSACGIEEASPEKKNELVIASDFLKAKDVSLFKTFALKHNINVKIRFLSADSIQKRLAKDGFNSEYDIVFVKSLESVKELNTISFHHLSKTKIKEELYSFRAFQNNSWFAVGLDPYVFSLVPDTLAFPLSYVELTQKFNYSSLNPKGNQVLLAHVKFLSNKKPEYYLDWKKEFEKNFVLFNSGTDSLPSNQFMLVKWSDYLNSPFFKKNKKREINYKINFANNGLYADRKCAAVIFEAKNFKNACLFLKYLNAKSESLYFYEMMGMIPIIQKNKAYDYEKIRSMKILQINEDSLLMNL